MSDLSRYIEDRKKNDADFGDNFESGAHEFKWGVMLKQAREEAGVTQEEVAGRKALDPSSVEKA